MKIGVLNNLRSGRGMSRVQQVLSVLESHPDVLHHETATAALVPEALADFERESVELLVVNGGDGTLQHVVTELLSDERRGWLPRLAPIRGGRTNMSAIDIGSHRDPAQGLAELIVAVKAGRIADHEVDRPVLRVDLGPDDGVQYGVFFGAGVLHRAVQLTPRYFPEGRSQGLFGAGMVTATLLARLIMGRRGGILQADKMQVALGDDRGEARELRVAMVTSAEKLFLGLRPFWGSGPGSIHVTLLDAEVKRLLRAGWGVLHGRPASWVTPELGYESHNCDRVAFQLDCGVTLDGEVWEAQPGRSVEITGDRRIRFVRG
jgi:diacylglycerol kinase (ATP)